MDKPNPFMQNLFEIREGNTITRFFKSQYLDFGISQRIGKGRTVTISYYSDPGFPLYAGCLKFALERKKLDIKEENQEELVDRIDIDDFFTTATFHGITAGANDFPLSHIYGINKGEEATLTISKKGKDEFLELSTQFGKILISQNLAEEIIRRLPKFYPNTTAFRHLNAAFFKSRKRMAEFKKNIKPKPLQRRRAGPKRTRRLPL